MDLLSVFLLETDATTVAGLVILLFTVLISVAVSTFVVAGLAYASAHVYLGRGIIPGIALERAWQRFWTYLGSLIILWSLVVGGLTVTNCWYSVCNLFFSSMGSLFASCDVRGDHSEERIAPQYGIG